MFGSSADKESERQAREADQVRAAEEAERRRREAAAEKERQAFLASPVGRATAARDAGHRFLELQLEVGTRSGRASFGEVVHSGSVKSSATVLAEVEDLGWRLEHASYFFVVTGQTSTEKVFFSGENTATQGVTMGAYLFRRQSSST